MTIRPWSQVPYDSALSTQTYQFLTWVFQSLISIQTQVVPIPAPVSVSVLPTASTGVVKLSWSAVPAAAKFNVFEELSPAIGDDPVKTIAANLSGGSNSTIRTGLTTGTTYFYAIQAVDQSGRLGAVSAFKKVVAP